MFQSISKNNTPKIIFYNTSAYVNVYIQNISFVKPCKTGIWCEHGHGLPDETGRDHTLLIPDFGVSRSFFWSWHDSRQEALLYTPKYHSFLLLRCNLLHLEPIWFKMACSSSSTQLHLPKPFLRFKVGIDITDMCLVFGFFGLTHRSETGKRLATHTCNAKCQRTVTKVGKGGHHTQMHNQLRGHISKK